jgi:predicted TIM-barrel fold metal-dependent hydrolase
MVPDADRRAKAKAVFAFARNAGIPPRIRTGFPVKQYFARIVMFQCIVAKHPKKHPA